MWTILLLLLALPGCGSSYERPFEIARSVESGPAAAVPTAIDVVNNKGGIEVRADPSYEEISVVATIHVSGDVEEDEREGVAEQVSVWTAMEEENGRRVLRVRAESARPEADDHRVSVQVRMPRCDGALVSSGAKGHIILVGVSGAIQAENREGAIDLRTDHRLTEPVVLSATKGNVYYQAPPGSTGRFELTSHDGKTYFASTEGMTQVYARKDYYAAVLNGGTNPVTLRSDEGDVRVLVRPDPVAYTRMIK